MQQCKSKSRMAGQLSQMGADPNMEANLSMFGGLALVSEVAPQCRWPHRWLIFIPQALKSHLCGKRPFKTDCFSSHRMPQFSAKPMIPSFCPCKNHQHTMYTIAPQNELCHDEHLSSVDFFSHHQNATIMCMHENANRSECKLCYFESLQTRSQHRCWEHFGSRILGTLCV